MPTFLIIRRLQVRSEKPTSRLKSSRSGKRASDSNRLLVDGAAKLAESSNTFLSAFEGAKTSKAHRLLSLEETFLGVGQCCHYRELMATSSLCLSLYLPSPLSFSLT